MIEPTALEKLAWFLISRSSSSNIKQNTLIGSDHFTNVTVSTWITPKASFCGGYTVEYYPNVRTFVTKGSLKSWKTFLARNTLTSTNLYRRDVYLAVGGSDESFSNGLEDWEYYLRVLSFGGWGSTLPEPLDWYR